MSIDPMIERLYHPAHHPFERLRFVGLAIYCRPRTAMRDEIRHVGVLYRNGTTIRLLHLPEHRRVADDPPSHVKYAWLAPPIPDARARVLAQQCVRIAANYREQGIPRALRYAGAYFEDGKLVSK